MGTSNNGENMTEDSYTDKNFELSKEDEKPLEEDEEDGFSFNCETCSF